MRSVKRFLRWYWLLPMAVLLLAAGVLLVNAIDVPLSAEAAAMGEPRAAKVAEADNAYLAAIGMGAPDGADSLTYARAWLAEARAAARENRPEKQAEAKRAQRPALCDAAQTSCLAALQDKEESAAAQIAAYGEDLARYEKLLAYRAFEEITDYPFGMESQFPRYAPMGAAQRAWLARAALALHAGRVDEALAMAERDIAFQRLMLTGSRTLVGRMVAAANYTRALSFVADLLQTSLADLKPHAPRLQAMLQPLQPAALNLDELMAGEFGMMKRFLHDPAGKGVQADWPEKLRLLLFYKRNATINDAHAFYSGKQQWLRKPPAQLAREIRDEVTEVEMKPWDYLYNPMGKILTRVAMPSFSSYALRLHDLDAMNRLLGLAAEIVAADVPAEDVGNFVAKAGARFADPYSGKPMTWDAADKRLSTSLSEAYARDGAGGGAKYSRKRFNIESGRVFIRL